MPYDRFLIAPFNTGLQTDLRAWMIPEDAFPTLINSYVFRGRVRKRFGTRLMGTDQTQSRLRMNVAMNDGMAHIVPGSAGKIGQMFSVGADIFTVYQTNGAMLSTNPLASGIFNTATGSFTITDAAQPGGTTVYWYPAQPVMGLTVYEAGNTPINNQPAYGFDTQFAYVFIGGSGWDKAGPASTLMPIWHGTNANFFWLDNWVGITVSIKVLFVTNFQVTMGAGLVTDDPIWDFDGTNWKPFSYSPSALLNPGNLQPLTVTGTVLGSPTIIANYVQSARIIVSFKDRLLLLNTIENGGTGATPITAAGYLASTNTAYTTRCRYSHNGSPFSTNAWLEQNQIYNAGAGVVKADGGGFIDATTDEQIVSAEFIKDRLIVYFERSTWELVYTGSQQIPFVWQKINTELGSEAQQSSVPFDKVVLTMGTTGVHACSGVNVERIDTKIPDEVFDIKQANLGINRVAGIRDYFTELVYWSFPLDSNQFDYPNRILVYNYRNGSWALNEDSFTAFNYFEQGSDATWASSGSLTWEESTGTWTDGVLEANARQIIAGNQEGWVLIIDANITRNAPALQITNISYPALGQYQLTIIDHNLELGQYLAIENLNGSSIAPVGNFIFYVDSVIDANNVIVISQTMPALGIISGVYTGGGTAARVSNLNIYSKQWNPYLKDGKNINLVKIDFLVLNSEVGQVTVDFYASSATNYSLLQQSFNEECNLGTNILETSPYAGNALEQLQERLWHPLYFQLTGSFAQINIFMSAVQISNTTYAFADFQMEAMLLYTMPSGRLQ